jgi:uncharacterized protein with von Willebrand factor type A (vWA) domain
MQKQNSGKTDNNVLDRIQYFLVTPSNDNFRKSKGQLKPGIKKEDLDKYLSLIGREVLRERTPDLRELAQSLENIDKKHSTRQENSQSTRLQNHDSASRSSSTINSMGASIIIELIEKGYLKDSQKWLSHKGFSTIGEKILTDMMKPLTSGENGLHETMIGGPGSVVLDSTKKFDYGNDLRMINVPKSLLNTLQRNAKGNRQIQLPLQINIDDFEEYETSRDVRVSLVYCIDLSSTMRYSSMFGDLSRIEAAKKALWGLFLFF